MHDEVLVWPLASFSILGFFEARNRGRVHLNNIKLCLSNCHFAKAESGMEH